MVQFLDGFDVFGIYRRLHYIRKSVGPFQLNRLVGNEHVSAFGVHHLGIKIDELVWAFDFYEPGKWLVRRNGHLVLTDHRVAIPENDPGPGYILRGIIPEKNAIFRSFFQIDRGVEVGVDESSDIPDRVPVLFPAFHFIGPDPGIVRLII